MKTKDFHFDLPDELVAQRPPAKRSDSRLLVLDRSGAVSDHRFAELPNFLRANDLLILNDTKVIPARLLGNKATGGRVEVLIERTESDFEALAHIRASKACKPGNQLLLEDELTATVLGREGDLFRIRLEGDEHFLPALERLGRIPLPPYIARPADENDRQRYQTVYAERPGAVAAPTAGLHFDRGMFERLQASGVRIGRLTLHVGAGTFQPVRAGEIAQHRMHRERIEVPEELVNLVNDTRDKGGRVVAVGTTVVRALESVASREGTLVSFSGETDIFISPGYRFAVIDAMITNFHLPESTLLMLVSAFAGTGKVLDAYRHAVEQGYFFFSYGDAMFIEKPDQVTG